LPNPISADFVRDARLAIRSFRRDPLFAILSVAILSIGLAFSAVMFSLVDATLLQPLPYRDPSRLVALYESLPVGSRFHISYDDFRDWQQQNNTFESVSIYRPDRMKLLSRGVLQHVPVARVSDGFFHTLGVAPALGRDFNPGDELAGSELTVVLSHTAWQSRFGSDAAIIGRAVTLDGTSFRIIGILPAQFHFAPAASAQFWITVHGFCGDAARRCHAFYGIGRLKNGVSVERGRADLQQIAQRIAAAFPSTQADRGAFVLPLADLILGNFRPTLIALCTGATLLLLIAILNVAGLLLVKAQRKQRDMAIRDALGASPARQVRQFATEGLLLSFTSFVLSIVVASCAIPELLSLIPSGLQDTLPSLRTLHPSWRLAASSGIAAAFSALLFAVVPLNALFAPTRTQALHEGGRYSTGTNWRRFGSKIMVGELALTVLLLLSAGLLAKSYNNLQHVDLGIVPTSLAVVRMEIPDQLNGLQRVGVTDRILGSVLALPGVMAAGVSYGVATEGADNYCHFHVPGRSYRGQGEESNLLTASAGYFEAVQASLIEGRFITVADRANGQAVAVLNETMAKHFFPSEDPIGKHVACEWSPNLSMEVIGVIRDIQEQAIDSEPKNAAYAAFEQAPDSIVFLTVRAGASNESFLPTLSQAVLRAAPGVVVDQPERMQEKIQETPSSYLHRSAAWLTSAFAAIAALLACAGLYGTVSHSVAQRTREIAVRLAVGAPIRSIYQLVLAEGLRLAGWGAVVGGLASLFVTSSVRSLLFGVKPWDASILSAVLLGVSLVALLACLVPGIQAARISPAEALKAE
jgi:macrolide transport system ATP-binding/permease protein